MAAASGDPHHGRRGRVVHRSPGGGRAVEHGPARTGRGAGPLDRLTGRELEVLELVAGGASNAAIAGRLGVGERAVEKHINSIFGKLDLAAGPDVNRRVVAVSAQEPDGGSDAPVRVLVVDDQAAFRDVVAQALQEADGFEVVGSLSGTRSLAAEVGRLAPDLVLLDVRMPGEDGATVALQLRRDRPDLSVVLMSVFDAEDVPAEVLRAGVGFLPKEELGPVPLAELHRNLRQLPQP